MTLFPHQQQSILKNENQNERINSIENTSSI